MSEGKDNTNDSLKVTQLMSPDAFESAFRQFYTPLYYHAYDITCDEETARDIVSEVFTMVWKKHRDIEDNGLKNYLYASVRNRSIDEMKRRGKMPEVPVDLASEIDENDYSWQKREDDISRLNKAIDKLPQRSQRLIDMRYRQRMPIAEIAVAEGISEEGVKKNLYRSLQRLRELLNAKNLLNIVHLLLL